MRMNDPCDDKKKNYIYHGKPGTEYTYHSANTKAKGNFYTHLFKNVRFYICGKMSFHAYVYIQSNSPNFLFNCVCVCVYRVAWVW